MISKIIMLMLIITIWYKMITNNINISMLKLIIVIIKVIIIIIIKS